MVTTKICTLVVQDKVAAEIFLIIYSRYGILIRRYPICPVFYVIHMSRVCTDICSGHAVLWGEHDGTEKRDKCPHTIVFRFLYSPEEDVAGFNSMLSSVFDGFLTGLDFQSGISSGGGLESLEKVECDSVRLPNCFESRTFEELLCCLVSR